MENSSIRIGNISTLAGPSGGCLRGLMSNMGKRTIHRLPQRLKGDVYVKTNIVLEESMHF